MCLSTCCLCSSALLLPHYCRKLWRRPDRREETSTKHPLDCHILLSPAQTKQKAFAADYSLKFWDLKNNTIFVKKRKKNWGEKPHPVGRHRGCGRAPQNGGVRNGTRVPQGGERGRGAQGTLCLCGATSTGKATRTLRPRIASSAARGE